MGMALRDAWCLGGQCWRLLARDVLAGDDIVLLTTSLDLVWNGLGHHRNAVNDWTDGRTQCTAYTSAVQFVSDSKKTQAINSDFKPLPSCRYVYSSKNGTL